MKLKLNGSKTFGLHFLIGYLLENYQPGNKAEVILYLLIDKIRLKLRSTLERNHGKDKFQITLTPEEALAFELWLSQISLPESHFQYEINVAQQICNQIDQQYGANFTRNRSLPKLAEGSPAR